MREYYGLFKELKNMYSESIEESDIYNGAFSQMYSLIMGGNFPGEIEFYVDAALNSGKNILEIACGDGKHVMIPLAKLGFNLNGRSVFNFYMEKDAKSRVKRYLASSNKKIISQDFIENNILPNTKFKSDKILDIDLGTDSGKVKMLSLEVESVR